MKIALIHSHLNGRGGSQRYVLEIANTLISLGVDVDVYAYEYNKLSCYPELTDGVKVKYIFSQENAIVKHNRTSVLRNLLRMIYRSRLGGKLTHIFCLDYLLSAIRNVTLAKKLCSIIMSQNKQYDLVFAHEEPLSIWAAINFKKKTATPVYWFCYDTIEKWFIDWKKYEVGDSIRSFLLRNIFFQYDKFIVVHSVDKIAVLDGNMRNKVKRMYAISPVIRRGGVPDAVLKLNKINYLKEKYAVAEGKKVVFSLTRFVEYRRIHDILELYRRLPDSIKDKTFFYINAPVSDENYFAMCEQKYSDVFSDENFIIDTSYPADDTAMYNMYLSADVFIFPNEKQTWGHAPLEAMACGCAAMVSDGCGIHEVIGQVSKTVFVVGNVDQMANMLIEMLEDNQYKKIAHIQKKYVEEHLTWGKICKKYVDDATKIINNAS